MYLTLPKIFFLINIIIKSLLVIVLFFTFAAGIFSLVTFIVKNQLLHDISLFILMFLSGFLTFTILLSIQFDALSKKESVLKS
jgi:hypothetical protein